MVDLEAAIHFKPSPPSQQERDDVATELAKPGELYCYATRTPRKKLLKCVRRVSRCKSQHLFVGVLHKRHTIYKASLHLCGFRSFCILKREASLAQSSMYDEAD